MINYYDILKLDKSTSTQDLAKQVEAGLLKTLRRQNIVRGIPQKEQENEQKLRWYQEASHIFSSEESRQAYDMRVLNTSWESGDLLESVKAEMALLEETSKINEEYKEDDEDNDNQTNLHSESDAENPAVQLMHIIEAGGVTVETYEDYQERVGKKQKTRAGVWGTIGLVVFYFSVVYFNFEYLSFFTRLIFDSARIEYFIFYDSMLHYLFIPLGFRLKWLLASPLGAIWTTPMVILLVRGLIVYLGFLLLLPTCLRGFLQRMTFYCILIFPMVINAFYIVQAPEEAIPAMIIDVVVIISMRHLANKGLSKKRGLNA